MINRLADGRLPSAMHGIEHLLRLPVTHCGIQTLCLVPYLHLQAMALLADGRLPSAVYGTEHLLRLFVKLPDLLAAAGAGGMVEEALLQTATAVQVGACLA